jgi:starch-binding outer membrane protein, SusD/RagB family
LDSWGKYFLLIFFQIKVKTNLEMKNFLNPKFLVAGAMALAIGACTDLKLQETDSVVLKSTGGFAKVDPTKFLASAYQDLGAFTDQANIYALTEHSSDEMIPPTRGVDWGDNGVWRTMDAHTWDPTHSWVDGSWDQLHGRAFRCNQILASDPTPAQAAETRFLRALYMSYAMDFWGQVPFREVTQGVDDNPKVLSRSEAFDFIVADLKAALPGLPKGGPKAENPKATQAAANTLLARLFLNKAVYKAAAPAASYTFDAADMNEVIKYCDAVTADGYSLEKNYFDAFTKTAKTETILTSAEGSPSNRWYMTLHYDQDPSGWNGFTTIADFYGKFADGDQRKGFPAKKDGSDNAGIGLGFLAGQQFDKKGVKIVDSRSKKDLVFTQDVPLAGAATDKGVRVIKYHPATAGQYIIFRYGDVLTMKMEAQFRGGTGGAAAALVTANDLRKVRGTSATSLPALAALTADAVADERAREMYWEGVRRMDQIRFGTFHTRPEVVNKDIARCLYPIPADAVSSNPNLKQNPGY